MIQGEIVLWGRVGERFSAPVRAQTTAVGIPSFVLSGTKRAAATVTVTVTVALAMAAAICTRRRENREPRSLVKVS
jgi:hypothetical protein